MKNFEYLDSEREKLWERVVALELELNKKTSDYEKEAKQASKKASEFKNRSYEAKELAVTNSNLIQTKADEAKHLLTNIKTVKTKSEDILKKIEDFDKDLDLRSANISSTVETLEENFEKNEELIEKLETLNSHFEEGDETAGKIETLYKSIQVRKREIDNTHRDIFGYTEIQKDENDKEVEVKIEGLKEQLDETYDELVDSLDKLEKDIAKTQTDTQNNYSNFIIEKEEHYKKTHDEWNKEYDSVLDKITKLLPNALTTGLSYAYSEKKTNELEESKDYAKTFRWAVFGLTLVSLIPFGLSVFFIYQDKPFLDVINYSPRLVLAIVPLYIPILWIAYSSNKKLNLSKRLIEEYTHKEVLSKTFEGLSRQIDSIDDTDISTDLKIKLLYNILSVSSENPGKLISDYNKSDHPLMDALEKSASLSDAVEKLENIPGLSKLTKILDRKSKKIIQEQAEKVDKTLGEVTEELFDDEIEKI
ncbi:hypothetical protein [Flavobacterium capsici]|uniref:Uncharacterized protein n=1 Tax=Flavobacterium capsici TaxID=3075618 RepID=A0AA96F5S9_9FLAO|nr:MULTISPECIES: hypothetical protein [unclassified Flavobacterium]WNM18099.1 hypothetical protein RN608_08745 [Flavobacterium sp. PMR2A8]WNM22151.1 hypothetical protein RN605_02045 [Flavobacterium sp. PMTSA4]